MAKINKKLANDLTLYIYKFISDNYGDAALAGIYRNVKGVCLLLDGADKVLKKKTRTAKGVSKIDVIHDGEIVGKITITSTFLYFIFAYPGSEEVEIDFLPLLKAGKSAEEVIVIAKRAVRTKLAADLEKSIGIAPHWWQPVDFRANPSKGTSVLGALILGGIIGHSMKK